MNALLHILDRFNLHIWASSGVLLSALIGLRYAKRKLQTTWLPKGLLGQLVVSSLIIFALTSAHEAWDVAHGEALVKVVTDDLSWFLGLGGWSYALYRLFPEK